MSLHEQGAPAAAGRAGGGGRRPRPQRGRRRPRSRRRRDARKERLTGWLPKPPARQTGLLAEKRRRQAGGTFAVLVAFNLLVFAFTQDFYVTGFTLVASLLGAPILHMMLFRKG